MSQHWVLACDILKPLSDDYNNCWVLGSGTTTITTTTRVMQPEDIYIYI